jgi:hypothetical protein
MIYRSSRLPKHCLLLSIILIIRLRPHPLIASSADMPVGPLTAIHARG